MRAFEKEIRSGHTQAELFYKLKELPGAEGVEIRRELMLDREREVPAIREANKAYGLDIIYSAPVTLYKDGRPDLRNLIDCAEEGAAMGAKILKLSTGAVDYSFPDKVVQALKAVLEILSFYELELTLENDQTECGGSLQSMSRVTQLCAENLLPVGCTFDAGNWLYVHEDPFAAARKLSFHVSYFHLKDVRQTEKGLEAVTPGKGFLDWKKLLQLMPQQTPIGLEFQISDMNEARLLIQGLKKASNTGDF